MTSKSSRARDPPSWLAAEPIERAGLDLPLILSAIGRRWWIVLLVPAIAVAGLIYRDRTLPYQSTLRASVVIPGDTETPGNAEKPELMVMDDAPGLLTSRAFAEAVAAKIGSGITVGDIQAALKLEPLQPAAFDHRDQR